ncbi:MAG: hypothetical protein ACLFTR_04055 [Candidatus Woesearchaeota archaeon]
MYENMSHSYMPWISHEISGHGTAEHTQQYPTEVSLETTLRSTALYDARDHIYKSHNKDFYELENVLNWSIDKSSYTPLGIDSMLEHQERYDMGDGDIDQITSERSDSVIAEVSADIIGSRLYGLGSDYLMMNRQQGTYLKPEEEKHIHVGILKKVQDDNNSIIDSRDMIEDVKEIFTAVTGEEMPEDIEINVLDKESFFKASAKRNGTVDGILGFAQHRKDIYTPRRIFVKTSTMAQVLAVIGHEIGHIISEKKGNPHDEEAKAIAFEYAWTKTIQEFNLGGVGHMIRSIPLARNGLHDIAQMFVENKIKEGIDPLDIFDEIVADEISVAQMASHVLPVS